MSESPLRPIHQTEWEAKKSWIVAMLSEMNADVIGFQEVVSHEELKALMAANGYPYFFCTGHPMFDPDDPAVYVNARWRLPRAILLSAPSRCRVSPGCPPTR
jgi:hypothetical protein